MQADVTRLENPGHLLYVLLLVWHVLARLAGPHQIKSVILEIHMKSVHDRKAAVAQPLL